MQNKLAVYKQLADTPMHFYKHVHGVSSIPASAALLIQVDRQIPVCV